MVVALGFPLRFFALRQARLLHSFHHRWIVRPLDAALLGSVESLRVQVVAALPLRFVLFDLDAVLVSESVLANPRDLPTDFHFWRSTLDSEAIFFDLFCDDGLGEDADDGQLIAEVSI